MLTGNVFIRASDGLKAIWFSSSLPDYFPLTSTSLWLEWRLWGERALGYHVTNVLLHLCSGFVLWRILLRLKIPGAFVASALFLVHPVNVESVAWIAERKNTLSLFFYLLAILFFVRGVVRRRDALAHGGAEAKAFDKYYFYSLGAFALSLLSKTSSVMLPFVLLLCQWWLNRKVTVRDCLKVVPFFIMALVFGLITIWFQYHQAIGGDWVPTLPLLQRIANAGRAVWFYLAKDLWPTQLSFVYPLWKTDLRSHMAHMPVAALIVVWLSFWRYRHSWGRSLFFALSYFILLLLPVLGFLKIYFQRYSWVADHWQYFAMIGVVALAAAVLSPRQREQRVSVRVGWWVVNVLVVGGLAFLSFKQCKIYESPEILWRDTLAKNPSSWLALNNFGLLLEQQGKVDEAAVLYKRSLQIQPEQVEGYNNFGALLLAAGSTDEAMVQFQSALQIDPKSAVTHYNIANTLDRQGKQDASLAEYQEALRLNPDYPDAHNNLACHLAAAGQLDEAVSHLKRALAVRPNYPDALNNLGSLLIEKGKADEAIPLLRKAAALNAHYADAQYNLGNALNFKEQRPDAIAAYSAALTINPRMPLAHFKLANTWLMDGKLEEALRHYGAAVELDPNLAEAHYQLGLLFARSGRHAESVEHLKAAVKLKPNWVEAVNNLAWIYATHANALYRDGDEAIRLARHAAELTGNKEPGVLDTLAAGYAQNRDFENATITLKKALELATAQHATNLVEQLQARLKLYESGEPFREK